VIGVKENCQYFHDAIPEDGHLLGDFVTLRQMRRIQQELERVESGIGHFRRHSSLEQVQQIRLRAVAEQRRQNQRNGEICFFGRADKLEQQRQKEIGDGQLDGVDQVLPDEPNGLACKGPQQHRKRALGGHAIELGPHVADGHGEANGRVLADALRVVWRDQPEKNVEAPRPGIEGRQSLGGKLDPLVVGSRHHNIAFDNARLGLRVRSHRSILDER
jgi:hypothetical protein